MPRKSLTRRPQIPKELPLGALVTGPSQVTFRTWAPWVKTLAVAILGSQPEIFPMQPQPFGYWETTVSRIGTGTRYQYVLHGTLRRPDPASRFQPEGVHGPSEVVDPSGLSMDRPTSGKDCRLQTTLSTNSIPAPSPIRERLTILSPSYHICAMTWASPRSN